MEQFWVSLEQSERFEEMAGAAMEVELVGVVLGGQAVSYLVSNLSMAQDIQLELDVEDINNGSLQPQPSLIGVAAAAGRER